MHQPANDTALLLFSRSSAAEARAKKFLLGGKVKQNEKLAGALIRRSVTIANQSRLPFYFFDEKAQRGNTFGERLANAIERIYSKGFGKVIVIGNDCLQLNAALIQQASGALNSAGQVLIPTAKGGVALIGLHKKYFDKSAFATIQWQTDLVYKQLLNLASAASCNTYTLPLLDDVNSYADLAKQLAHIPVWDKFRQLVTSLVASFQVQFQNIISLLFLNEQGFIFGLRAPPAI